MSTESSRTLTAGGVSAEDEDRSADLAPETEDAGTDTEETPEKDGEQKEAEKAKPSRRWSVARRRFLRSVPFMALAGLITVSVLLSIVWQQKNDLSHGARQQRDLGDSASRVADTFFNWDYQHMEQSFNAKYPLLTKAAADTIRPTAATLTGYFTANKISSKADITGIYPGGIKGGKANVMVVMNTKVTTSKTIQSNTGATLALGMTRVSGKWLAANISLLAPGAESVTDQNGKPLKNGTNGASVPNAIPTTSLGSP
jgi:hypothetical protein